MTTDGPRPPPSRGSRCPFACPAERGWRWQRRAAGDRRRPRAAPAGGDELAAARRTSAGRPGPPRDHGAPGDRDERRPRDYTSGRVNSAGRRSSRRRSGEASIRIPTEQGLVPAFWTSGRARPVGPRPTNWPRCRRGRHPRQQRQSEPGAPPRGPDGDGALDRTPPRRSLGSGYSHAADLDTASTTTASTSTPTTPTSASTA